MSDKPKSIDLSASYSALTEGELLALATEQGSLTETAKKALAAELRRRGLDETDIAAFQRDAERGQSRRARWHRKQWMHLRELLSVMVVWPGTLLIPLGLAAALVFMLDTVLRNVLGLSLQQANFCEEIAAVGVVVVWFVIVAVFILSDRSNALIRRWIPGSDRKPKTEEEKLRAHQRICPARNVGIALFLLLFSLYVLLLSVRDVEGWSFLREQSPQVGWPYTDVAGGIFLIFFFSYFLAKAPCLREKLWLAFATANFLLRLPKHLLHTLNGHELRLGNIISMVLWAAASIVALSIVKSAWQEPATRDSSNQR
jgi:hypothetical protein